MACAAAAWQSLTFVGWQWILFTVFKAGGGPGSFLAHVPWLRYVVFYGLPIIGIAIGLKGARDAHRANMKGVNVGIGAAVIGLAWLCVGYIALRRV